MPTIFIGEVVEMALVMGNLGRRGGLTRGFAGFLRGDARGFLFQL
jgi:hypothetical protein